MAPTEKVETDQRDAIIRIADANNVIREKEASIVELTARQEELKADVAKYEQAKNEVVKENAQVATELERLKTAVEKQKKAFNDSFDAREKELADREEAISAREEEMKSIEVEATQKRAELAKLKEEAEQADAKVSSKLENVKRIAEARATNIAELETKRSDAETQIKKLEVLREEIAKESEKLTELRNKAIDSENQAIELWKSITEERRLLEATRQSVAHESSCADFNKAQAGHLITVFRQALHSYVQIAGVSIQIPELTNEHKEFIAKDLLEQVGKKNDTAVKSSKEELEESFKAGYQQGVDDTIAGIEAQKEAEIKAEVTSTELPAEVKDEWVTLEPAVDSTLEVAAVVPTEENSSEPMAKAKKN